MILKPYYKPGGADWLRINSLLDVIRVHGRPLNREEKKAFKLKGMLPRASMVPENLSSKSPDLLPEVRGVVRFPGTIDNAGTAQGPYALHMGGGMYARQVRLRTYGVG